MTSRTACAPWPLRLCVAALLGLLLQGPPARAESPKEEARKLFREANRLFARQMYLDALNKYRAARALYPSYKIDLNIGGTLDALGRSTEAAVYFERFLIQSSSAPPEIIESARQRLSELRSRLGRVKITCAVEGATVLVDDKGVGTVPLELPVYLEPGSHRVEAHFKGRRSAVQKIRLAAGQHETVDLLFGVAAPTDAAVPASAPVARAEQPPPDPARARQRRARTLWAYGALALGGACAVTGAVLYGVGGSQGSAAYDSYKATTDPTEMDRHYADVESAKDMLVAAHVLMGVSAAALGASLYLLLTRPTAEAPRSTLGATLLPGGGAISVSGAF